MEMEPDLLDQVGARLAVLAKISGLTQEEVAKRCRISRITINRFFRGKTEIRSGDLVQLLGLFGIDLLKMVDDRIERRMKGVTDNGVDTQEIARALEDLDPHVSRTILEQISWWKRTQSPMELVAR